MEFESFINALRKFHNQRPFRQYEIELMSGTVIRVRHPDTLAFYGRRVVVLSADGLDHQFDHDSVARVTTTLEPAESAGPSIKL